MRSGRDVQEFDTARSHRVMVVNESFVRSHLAGQNPLGTIVRTLAEPGFPGTTYEIVGVVGDTKYADLRDENCWCDTAGGAMAPIAYVPIAQNPSPYAWAAVMVRSELPVGAMRTPIARRVEQLNPSIATHVMELKARVRERLVGERVVASLAGAFGVLATVLVVAGLYGIIVYLVVSRRNEIGIRLSLGATRAQIVRLVLRDNLWLLGVGLATRAPACRGGHERCRRAPVRADAHGRADGRGCHLPARVGRSARRRCARVASGTGSSGSCAPL